MSQPWFALAVVTMTVAVVVVLVNARRGGWEKGALWAAVANLAVAALNSVAPFRAVMDSGYVGYSFGLLSADHGAKVSWIAGSLVLATVVAATIAARHRQGSAMWVVVAVDAAVCIALLGGIFEGGGGPEQFKLQFGEYLTIPGFLGLAVIVGAVLLPLGGSAIWAARRVAARG
jgi:hypothetical protein